MDEELRNFIKRRRSQLQHQLTAARNYIAAIEARLLELDHADKSLPSIELPALVRPRGLEESTTNSGLIHADMTIKQLVMETLRSSNSQGLNAGQLRDYIRDVYGRSIDRNSLRPQLSRLKAEGRIDQSPDGLWYLLP